MKKEATVIGRKILAMRAMTDAEMESEGWDGPPPTVLILEGGALLYPSQDPEGNGPGALFGVVGGEQVAYIQTGAR